MRGSHFHHHLYYISYSFFYPFGFMDKQSSDS